MKLVGICKVYMIHFLGMGGMCDMVREARDIHSSCDNSDLSRGINKDPPPGA